MRGRASRWGAAVATYVLVLALAVLSPEDLGAQRLTYSEGQPVYPAYEGWRRHADGTVTMMFGYMNENWDETHPIALGDNNFFSPGPPDRGQPTYFLPRRNRFVFEVPVPENFGDQELVWTVVANGQEHKAYGTLREDYYVDNVVIMSETGALGAGTSSPEIRANIPPVIDLEIADRLTAEVGEPLALVAKVTDDGQPPPEGFLDAEAPEPDAPPLDLLERALDDVGGSTVNKAVGLHFMWLVYRGSGNVSFDPQQIKPWEDTRTHANSPWAPYWLPPELRNPSELPEDGRWVSEATFHEPGTYVLRGRADDGGLYSDVEVTVEVSP
ncbi:MAG: hypothetical protein GEU90_18015 [Gemmatimonas sp.]|nr:hypothetical protein [Gemmatimonas sp.]